MLKYVKGNVHDVPESIIRALGSMVSKNPDNVPLILTVNCQLDADKLTKLRHLTSPSADTVVVETKGTVDMEGAIIMSRNNPSGFPLEYLVNQVTKDLDEKSGMIDSDHSMMAEVVRSNNAKILDHLHAIQALHNETRTTLECIAKDSGVSGKPRLGDGQ